MSTTYKRSRTKHGDPVLTITVVGWHDIFRVTENLLHAQCEFADASRKTLQWMRRGLGASRYDAFDKSMTGGKTRRYAIRPRERV
jgi:hypothetical protein